MSKLLGSLLGRIPIGWLQLTHNPGRLLAAVAGITFANVLVFVQLGIMGAMNTTIVRDYDFLNADIMISAADANTLLEGSDVPRQLMFRALSLPSVRAVSPLFIGSLNYNDERGETFNFQTWGFDPQVQEIMAPVIDAQRDILRLENTVVSDRAVRGLQEGGLATAAPDNPISIEINGLTVTSRGTISLGAGFSGDGAMVTSDQTFLRLFQNRQSAAPDHILVALHSGTPVDVALAQLSQLIPPNVARVRSVETATQEDLIYQTTERPTGLIFGFGVVMGVIVGVVIVYQILSTDVADHIREYATFKAMGYPPPFFLGIIFEEAVILAIFGFIPGFLISWGCYLLLNSATGLPLMMDLVLAVIVLVGTIAACTLSGAIANRRLSHANPADLF